MIAPDSDLHANFTRWRQVSNAVVRDPVLFSRRLPTIRAIEIIKNCPMFCLWPAFCPISSLSSTPVDSSRANSPEFRACRSAKSGNLGGAQHTKLLLNLSAVLRPH